MIYNVVASSQMGGRSISISVSVCQSVWMSICLHILTTTCLNFSIIFCTC